MEPATSQPLPPEIRVERHSPGDVRYVLPRRPLGKWRCTAAVPFVFALISLAFLWDWFKGIGGWPAQMPGAFELLFQAIGLASAIPMVLLPIALGLAIAWGHSEIEVRAGRIWCSERVGLLRWRRRRPLADVQRLVVCLPHAQESTSSNSNDPVEKFVAIRAEVVRGKPLWGAIGYPREWLVPLAHELARHVRPAQHDLSQPTVVVEDDRISDVRLDQPGGSLITMTEQSGGLLFDIPPAGIKRGAGGLFIFACIWLAFMAVCTAIALFGQRQPQPGQDDAPIWVLALVLGFFWLIGIGLMLLALSIARHRAAIVVADGRCLLVETGLFSEKKQVWEPGELRSVQVGPSSMEVNDQPVMELQFILATGDKVGIFAAHDIAELQWLATHLRQALALTPITCGAVMVADVDLKPATSDAVFDEQPGGLTIRVPRSSLRRRLLGYWITPIIGSVILAIVTTVFVTATRNGPVPWDTFMPFAILSVLGLVNLVMFGVALHMTIRRAAVAFASGRLLVLQFGLLGKRRHEWAVEELAAIRASASGTKINNRRLMHLQIVPVSGKTVSLLLGREDEELAWIATQLRRATQLPAETPAEREKQLPKPTAFYPRSASETQARSGGPM